MIEDILPFVLNTEWPVTNAGLLRYEQNSFGCISLTAGFQLFQNTPKTILLISQQPSIHQRSFCIQNEPEDILFHLI